MPRSATNSDGSPPLRQCSSACPRLGLESLYLNVSPPRARFRRGLPPFLCPIVLPIISGVHQGASVAQRDLLIGVSTTATRGQTPQQSDQRKRTRLCVPSGGGKERKARVETVHYREW